MDTIHLTFTGTAGIAAPLFNALASDERFKVTLVITGEDKPAGRKMELAASPIKQAARKFGLPLFQPADINAAENVARLREEKPDLLLVMAYGQILSPEVLKIPKHGCINIHASLLPRHRGASPIPNALLAGDKETGISVMRMEAKMDTGPVYKTFSIPIEPDDNVISLTEKLAYLAAQKTPEVLLKIAGGAIAPPPQDEKEVTYCQKISKADGAIDWRQDAEMIARKVRAYAGWPGTHTLWNGKLLKILEGRASAEPGEPGVVTPAGDKILVGTSRGSLELKSVQLEGKKAVPIRDFIKGHSPFIGAKLG